MFYSGIKGVAPTADALGRRLKAIRERHGVTGKELAHRLGCGQAKVSKIETGKLKPSDQFVRDFAEALRLPESERVSLELGTQLFLLEFDRWHLGTAGSAAKIQDKIAGIESAAERFRVLDWFVVSGLLQTEAYATYLYRTFSEVSQSDAEHAVRRRMRRQKILKQRRRKFSFILAEHVFYINFCPRDVVLEQLSQVKKVARLPNVTLRILPAMAPLRAVPVSGFDVMDDNLVLVETRDFQFAVWDPREVQGYIGDYDLVEKSATRGLDETSEAIERISAMVRDHWV